MRVDEIVDQTIEAWDDAILDHRTEGGETVSLPPDIYRSVNIALERAIRRATEAMLGVNEGEQ